MKKHELPAVPAIISSILI